MAIIDSPKKVAGSDKGGFLEAFQIAYGIYDMAYKMKTRKLQSERYTEDRMDEIYKGFTSNRTNIDVINNTINRLEEVGKNTYMDPDSASAQGYFSKLDNLKIAREQTLQLQDWSQKLDTRYDIGAYVNIRNEEGWTSTGLWGYDKDGKYVREVAPSDGPSNTVKKLDSDIKRIQGQIREMSRMGYKDADTTADFEEKIKQLRIYRGWVGYDGILTQQDAEHAAQGETLKEKFTTWSTQLNSAKASLQMHKDDYDASMKRGLTESETGWVDDQNTIDNYLAIKESHKNRIAELQSHIDYYRHDYIGLDNPNMSNELLSTLVVDDKGGKGGDGGKDGGSVDGTMKLIGGQEPREWGPESINQDEEKEFQEWIGGKEEKEEEVKKVSTAGVFWDVTEKRWGKVKDNDVVRPSAAEVKQAKEEGIGPPKKSKEFGNRNNANLRRAVNSIARKKENRGKYNVQEIMRSIKSGRAGDEKYKESTFDIPEELLKQLPKEWQDYVLENTK